MFNILLLALLLDVFSFFFFFLSLSLKVCRSTKSEIAKINTFGDNNCSLRVIFFVF